MKIRLIAALLGLTLAVLLVHDIPLARYLRTVENDRITTALERDSFVLAGRSEEALENLTQANLTRLWNAVDSYSKKSGARVIVTDKLGKVILATEGLNQVGTSYASRPEIKTALKGEVASGTRYSGTLKEDILYVAVPVLNGNQIMGVIRATFPTTFIDTAVSQRLQGITTVAVITLLLAAILAVVLASSVTRRLRDLGNVTEAFARGDHTVRADQNDGAPEIKALAASFNTMAEQISHLIAQQKAFAGDASHQLRTPLTALQLRLERATEMIASDPNGAATRIEAAMVETERLQRLVEGLLLLSRSEGAQEVDPIPSDLTGIGRERVANWQALGDERNVKVDAQLPDNLLVMAIPGAIEQVLDNYIDNALELAPAGSQITISATRDEQTTTIHVIDSGPGMSDDDLAKAFNRFWRARSDAYGSGLGLAIVERLMVASGGSARLINRIPNGMDAQAEFLNA